MIPHIRESKQATNDLALLLLQGYAPIFIRLVEAALKGGWGPVAEVLSMLPGGQFDSLQVRTGSTVCQWQAGQPLQTLCD